MNKTSKSSSVLIILDGWGYSESQEHNAIVMAATPNWDKLWQDSPHTLLTCSGPEVGLPAMQMGNSEVGHMHMGAGRVIEQDLVRIDNAINTDSLAHNTVLRSVLDKTVQTGGSLHLIGLLSDGGVHSHERHLHGLLKIIAKHKAIRVYVHAFLDGRDTPPHSALGSIEKAESLFFQLGCGTIASVCGRYYGMDRNQNWERTEKTWRLLTQGQAEWHAQNASEALSMAYQRGESDEFVQPTMVLADNADPVHIQAKDSVIFMNFRADRARQLSQAFIGNGFGHFAQKNYKKPTCFASLTSYDQSFDIPVLFQPVSIKNSLGEYLSEQNKSQLRLAETEKYAHVTYFFNGGKETPFINEKRIMVPSPKVDTYDLAPDMSAFKVTDRLVESLQNYDLIVCNYANGDMVGHTGILPAAIQAVETIDTCLGIILKALDASQTQCLITADHGNVEQLFDPSTGQSHTSHTCAQVPLIYYGDKNIRLHKGGSLTDVAPTLLDLMDLPKPQEMTGSSLAFI